MKKAKVLNIFFAIVFTDKTCVQQSHIPEIREKIWRQEGLPSVVK